jgi:hypothetical protein
VYIHIGKRKRHQMASHQTFWLRFFYFSNTQVTHFRPI